MTGVRVKTALIGIGAWGRNSARELSKNSDLVAYASQGSPESLAWAKEHLPNTERRTLEEICADPSVSAVVVASPIATHASIGAALIASGKHVLIEKPMGRTSDETLELVRAAKEKKVTLSVGYVFLYDEAYEELRRRAPRETIRRVTATWNKYGTFKEPIELNLLTHHLAFARDLLGTPTHGTLVRGKSVESTCDEVDTTLLFSEDISFSSHIDRTVSERTHELKIWLNDGTILVWEPGTLYKEKDKVKTMLFHSTETPLSREIKVFLGAVHGESGSFDGMCAAEVLQLLESLTS